MGMPPNSGYASQSALTVFKRMNVSRETSENRIEGPRYQFLFSPQFSFSLISIHEFTT